MNPSIPISTCSSSMKISGVIQFSKLGNAPFRSMISQGGTGALR